MCINQIQSQCLANLILNVLDTKLCDKVCQRRWFSTGSLVSSTSKADCHDITEILLKVTLNTINQTKPNQSLSQNVLLLIIWNNAFYCNEYLRMSVTLQLMIQSIV